MSRQPRRARVTNILAVVVALYVGRCTADLPAMPDPLVLCTSLSPEVP